MTGEQAERRSKGSSISRVLKIVEAVAQSEQALSPAELAFMLDIPKPSIHRLQQQLQADGYLQMDLRGLIVPSDRLQRIAMGKALRHSILQRVARETGKTCGIVIPDGIDMVY
ncbi:helix-turn-helix domain-containing protein [Azorhizophilus paspali]|uniref:Helix-turn-helix domain-containing protein n=1 Tax=Azorhizophilus paspali TaxID=69963 RepID=A0ABV6SPZ8_AZOPA